MASPTSAFVSQFVVPFRAQAPRVASHSCTQSSTSGPVLASAIRRTQNVPGEFFVDTSCIDCDTCRWFAPETFQREGGQSAVHKQPGTEESRLRALGAAIACPTGSIRTETPTRDAKTAQSMFPLAVNDEKTVFYLGYTSRDTFGASAWLCITPERSFMIDVPRYNSALAKHIDEVIAKHAPSGKLDYIVLTHSDDVAGHDAWAKRFPDTERIIHAAEANGRQKTDECEIKLRLGEDGHLDRYKLASGVEIVHVPGHTRGSIAVVDANSKSLFSGDHIFHSQHLGRLGASTRYCSFSWEVQQTSVAKLANEPFLSIYPGHGRMHTFRDEEDRRQGILETADWMTSVLVH